MTNVTFFSEDKASDNPRTKALVLPANTNVASPPVRVPPSAAVTSRPTKLDIDRFNTYMQLASGCGTQHDERCMSSCKTTRDHEDGLLLEVEHCGSCEVFRVGNATFTAITPLNLNDAFWSDLPVLADIIEGPLERLLEYNAVFGSKAAADDVPWCFQSQRHKLYEFQNTPIWQQHRVSPLWERLGRVDDGVKDALAWSYAYNWSWDPVSVLVADMTSSNHNQSLQKTVEMLLGGKSIVYNCSMWDKLGVGCIHKRGKSRAVSRKQTATVADAAFTSWRPIYTERDQEAYDQAAKKAGFFKNPVFLKPIANFEHTRGDELDVAVASIAQNAARLLDQQVATELATPDSTKTVLGALWDMSVVVLGIVAMACGRADTEKWIEDKLIATFLCFHGNNGSKAQYVAKVVYCSSWFAGFTAVCRFHGAACSHRSSAGPC